MGPELRKWMDDWIVGSRFDGGGGRGDLFCRDIVQFLWDIFCLQWLVVSWAAVVGRE